MKFYISDTHFNSENRFENRTLEHDVLIHDNWNSVVTNKDEVYIAGDVGKVKNTKDIEYVCKVVASLKGRKTLIIGNHDKALLKDYRFTKLFDELVDYKEVIDDSDGNHKVAISHYPIFSWNGAYGTGKGNRILLYGHLHNNTDDVVYQNSLNELRKWAKEASARDGRELGTPYAINIGAMMPYMDYCPRTLAEISSHKVQEEEQI